MKHIYMLWCTKLQTVLGLYSTLNLVEKAKIECGNTINLLIYCMPLDQRGGGYKVQ